MATIYDVAEKAGVSPKTVSRVLNGDAPVGKATREAVEAAMDQLGYVRNNAARMMRATRSGLIGLVTGAITKDMTQPAGLPDLFIVQGVQARLAEAGKTLMIADTAGRQDRIPALLRTFQEHRVEGLIYVADHHQKLEDAPEDHFSSGLDYTLSSDQDNEEVHEHLVIAEIATNIQTMSPSDAAMRLELSGKPALMFRNANHKGLNMVYRRPDGNIGWVDPDGKTTELKKK